MKPSLTAADGDTLKGLLVVGKSVPLVAVRVYPEPTRLMLSPLKVATPMVALTVVVPDRVAPLVPVPGVMARVIGPVYVVTVLPLVSCTVTVGCVVKAVPLMAPAGEVVNTSLEAAWDTLKLLLIAEVSPVVVAVSV